MSDQQPDTNGASKKPARKPREKRTKPPAKPKPSKNGKEVKAAVASEEGLPGRWGHEIPRQEVTWFLRPYIPNAMLTLVSGPPNAGKSTFAAYLMGRAKRTVLLSGREEPLELMTIARLAANGVKLDTVLAIDKGTWDLPNSEQKLVDVLQKTNANLLVFDPISSYLAQGMTETDPAYIRAALESAQGIALKTGAAVVGIRHPGKDPTNVLPGSHVWRDVPRSVVQLIYDPGPPLRRVVRLFKDSLGENPPLRPYILDGPDGQPKVFVLEPDNAVEEMDLIVTRDPLERMKIDMACDLLRALLAEEEMEVSSILAIGAREGLNDQVMYRAGRRLGRIYRREGNGMNHKVYWRLPRQTDTHEPPVNDAGGGHPGG